MRVHLTRKATILLASLAAGLTMFHGCSGTSPHCLIDDAQSVLGKWRYTGKVGSPGSPSASEGERPAQLEFRPDGTFTALYDAPAPADISGGKLNGRWNGGRNCAGSLFLAGTEVATDPRIPRTSVMRVDGDRLLLFGSASGFYDAEYERVDRPAPSAAAAAAIAATATPSPATDTPTEGPRAPTPNPWRGSR